MRYVGRPKWFNEPDNGMMKTNGTGAESDAVFAAFGTAGSVSDAYRPDAGWRTENRNQAYPLSAGADYVCFDVGQSVPDAATRVASGQKA